MKFFFIHFRSRLRQHGTVYAMILLYSFPFTVRRARHCICHDTSFFFSVHGYASGTVYAMILLYSFQFSSWLREYGTVYAMILLYSFQFSSWLREYGTVYAMILLYCIYDVSMSLETKPKKSPCIKISSSVELK